MRGQVISGNPEALFCGATLDSRRVQGEELFFALPGEQTDGHRFVSQALEAGAVAAVVERLEGDVAQDATLIQVENTYRAFHDLTRHVRRRVPEHLVGVTGSAGKTTTKELLCRMLQTRFRTSASPGNLNNLYGFPLALLNLEVDCEWMVAEMGMSEPGELGQISRLARPDVVLLTNVMPVHMSSFGSLRQIAAAKAEILEGLAEDGLVVLNAADTELLRVGEEIHHQRPHARVVWFALEPPPEGPSCPLRVKDLELAPKGVPGSRFDLEWEGRRASVKLSLPGSHNVENCLGAATVALELGVDVESVAAAASAATPAPMRGLVHTLSNGARVWDDSYNSNPGALRCTLRAAAQVESSRRWAILGEMLELGPDADELHRQAGTEAAGLGFSPVVGVGELARGLVEEARTAGAEGEWFHDSAAAEAFARNELEPGDLLLVKGSRGVGLDALVKALRGED